MTDMVGRLKALCGLAKVKVTRFEVYQLATTFGALVEGANWHDFLLIIVEDSQLVWSRYLQLPEVSKIHDDELNRSISVTTRNTTLHYNVTKRQVLVDGMYNLEWDQRFGILFNNEATNLVDLAMTYTIGLAPYRERVMIPFNLEVSAGGEVTLEIRMQQALMLRRIVFSPDQELNGWILNQVTIDGRNQMIDPCPVDVDPCPVDVLSTVDVVMDIAKVGSLVRLNIRSDLGGNLAGALVGIAYNVTYVPRWELNPKLDRSRVTPSMVEDMVGLGWGDKSKLNLDDGK